MENKWFKTAVAVSCAVIALASIPSAATWAENPLPPIVRPTPTAHVEDAAYLVSGKETTKLDAKNALTTGSFKTTAQTASGHGSMKFDAEKDGDTLLIPAISACLTSPDMELKPVTLNPEQSLIATLSEMNENPCVTIFGNKNTGSEKYSVGLRTSAVPTGNTAWLGTDAEMHAYDRRITGFNTVNRYSIIDSNQPSVNYTAAFGLPGIDKYFTESMFPTAIDQDLIIKLARNRGPLEVFYSLVQGTGGTVPFTQAIANRTTIDILANGVDIEPGRPAKPQLFQTNIRVPILFNSNTSTPVAGTTVNFNCDNCTFGDGSTNFNWQMPPHGSGDVLTLFATMTADADVTPDHQPKITVGYSYPNDTVASVTVPVTIKNMAYLPFVGGGTTSSSRPPFQIPPFQ